MELCDGFTIKLQKMRSSSSDLTSASRASCGPLHWLRPKRAYDRPIYLANWGRIPLSLPPLHYDYRYRYTEVPIVAAVTSVIKM